MLGSGLFVCPLAKPCQLWFVYSSAMFLEWYWYILSTDRMGCFVKRSINSNSKRWIIKALLMINVHAADIDLHLDFATFALLVLSLYTVFCCYQAEHKSHVSDLTNSALNIAEGIKIHNTEPIWYLGWLGQPSKVEHVRIKKDRHTITSWTDFTLTWINHGFSWIDRFGFGKLLYGKKIPYALKRKW